ncbi:MAG TPA: adventurous gliding motility lipoprotein CglB [Myxococcaceae bacterium]|nr:adventurous gliding motility lipoprotein CglB [Myxococcaceae bacterium]
MRSRPLVLVALLLVAGLACQTYDFIPVEPLSVSQEESSTPIVIKKFKPNVMVLVDKSGSMDQPTDSSLPGCTQAGTICGTGANAKSNPCNVNVCPTRWSELNLALDSFLQAQAQTVRFGLSFFPEPVAQAEQPNCVPTSAARVGLPSDTEDDSPATLSALSLAARTALASVRSQNPPGPTGTGGATPTGPSLEFFSGYTPLLDPLRLDLVLLLTDGLPNCNGGISADGCICTATADHCPPQSSVSYDCLDKDRTVQAVQDLSARGVHVVVIGFGDETRASTDGGVQAPIVLQEMALAGTYPRLCPGPQHDQPCGPANPCQGGVCLRQYYQAQDSRELGAALAEITASLDREPCLRAITPAPTSEDLILLTLNGTKYGPGPDTWQYVPPADGGPGIRFLGSLCAAIEASTAQKPVQLDLRILRVL